MFESSLYFIHSIIIPLADVLHIQFLMRLIVPIIVLYLLHLTFIVLPQRQELKRLKALSSSVCVGDAIVTSSGLRGTVVQKGRDTVIISLSHGAMAEVELTGIRDVIARKH